MIANETLFAGSLLGLGRLGVIKMTSTRTMVVSTARPTRNARRTASALTGCPWHDVKAMLRQVGLRPTRQRMALGWILFAKGDRHLTAEMLYEEATRRKCRCRWRPSTTRCTSSPRSVCCARSRVDGSKTYFDTNASAPSSLLRRRRERAGRYPGRRGDCRARLPTPPEGYRDRPHRRGRAAAPEELIG